MKLIRAEEYEGKVKQYFTEKIEEHKHDIDILECNADLHKIMEECVCEAGWIPCEERLPEISEELLLVQCNGQYKNIRLHNALCLAMYTDEGWELEMYPEWDGAEIVAWQQLPEIYKNE